MAHIYDIDEIEHQTKILTDFYLYTIFKKADVDTVYRTCEFDTDVLMEKTKHLDQVRDKIHSFLMQDRYGGQTLPQRIESFLFCVQKHITRTSLFDVTLLSVQITESNARLDHFYRPNDEKKTPGRLLDENIYDRIVLQTRQEWGEKIMHEVEKKYGDPRDGLLMKMVFKKPEHLKSKRGRTGIRGGGR